MKKIIITLLSLVLALAFVGCTNTAATTTTTTTAAETTTAAAQEEEAKAMYYGELAYGVADEKSLYEQALAEYGNAELFDGTTNDQYRCKLYDDMNSALLALQKQDIRSLNLAVKVAEYIAAQNPEQYEIYRYKSVNELAFAMAMKSEDADLQEKLNNALSELKTDGTLEALEKEYLSDLAKLPEAKDIPKIDGAETVRVVVTGDQPPFDYVTADGKAAGYNVALLSAISGKIGMNIELVYANAGSRFIQLTSGKADVIFWARGEKYSESAEFNFSDDLPEGMIVTDPYITQDWCALLLKSADSTETTTAAAQETQIFYYGMLAFGRMDEDGMSDYDLESNQTAGITAWEDGTTPEEWRAVLYDDLNSALLGLDRGDVDEIDGLKSLCQYIEATNPDKYVAGDYGSIYTTVLSLAVMKENTALLDKLNTAIRALKADGTLKALEEEYFTDLSKLPEAKDIPTIEGAETIRVVVTGDMPPYDYVTSDGKAAGYNVALLTAISEKAQLNIELVYANAGSRYIQLTSGKADAVFWTRGVFYEEAMEPDYSCDMPDNMAVTDAFTTQEIWHVYLK